MKIKQHMKPQKHIRSNETKPHNTEDQTTHEATKTHKIKQHIKPHNTEDQTTHETTQH